MKRKLRRKFFVLSVVFLILCVSLFGSFRTSYAQVNEKIEEKEKLSIQYQELVEEQDALEKEVVRLQDPEYIARYVREKYMYSKDGEIILRIEDK